MSLYIEFPVCYGIMLNVTKLLDRAIAQVRELPEEQQDAVAANLISAIDDRLTEDEERELFESRREYERGEFRPYQGARKP